MSRHVQKQTRIADKDFEQCRGAPWHMGCAHGIAQLQHKHQMSTLSTANCLGAQELAGKKRSGSLRDPSRRQRNFCYFKMQTCICHLLLSAQKTAGKKLSRCRSRTQGLVLGALLDAGVVLAVNDLARGVLAGASRRVAAGVAGVAALVGHGPAGSSTSVCVNRDILALASSLLGSLLLHEPEDSGVRV